MSSMGGNTFYSNAEAYAFEILQQKLMKEAQRSAQQNFMELSALKSLFGQGQLIYCIPFGASGLPNFPVSFPLYPAAGLPAADTVAPLVPDPQHFQHNRFQAPALPPLQQPLPNASSPLAPLPPPFTRAQSTVRVNVKNGQAKLAPDKPGSDECNLGKEGIELSIDLREYLPAEISLNVEEKLVEIKAYHLNSQGSKSFSRKYDLPACIALDSVKCILSHDGFFLFWAAWWKME